MFMKHAYQMLMLMLMLMLPKTVVSVNRRIAYKYMHFIMWLNVCD